MEFGIFRKKEHGMKIQIDKLHAIHVAIHGFVFKSVI